MSGWQFPGVPPVPSWTDLARLVQAQTELLSELPQTLAELNQAIKGISLTLETARETIEGVARVVERLEHVVDGLEEPVQGLRPGIERINHLLEAPVIQRIPSTLEAVEAAVIPLAAALNRARSTAIAWSGPWRRLHRRRGHMPR